jgi:hypothetical protein
MKHGFYNYSNCTSEVQSVPPWEGINQISSPKVSSIIYDPKNLSEITR